MWPALFDWVIPQATRGPGDGRRRGKQTVPASLVTDVIRDARLGAVPGARVMGRDERAIKPPAPVHGHARKGHDPEKGETRSRSGQGFAWVRHHKEGARLVNEGH